MSLPPLDPPSPEGGTGLVDPWGPYREEVVRWLTARLTTSSGSVSPSDLGREIQFPEETRGDLSIPLFRWAKEQGRDPVQWARQLAGSGPPPEGLTQVRSEGGFLNFDLDIGRFFAHAVSLILRRGSEYGRFPPRPESVCVEHTSANPSGPLHVGRSRNSIVGDTLARVLRARGYSVTVQFYVDDVGRQAATLVWLWGKPPAAWPSEIREAFEGSPEGPIPPNVKPDTWYGRPYPAASQYLKTHPEAAQELHDLVTRFQRGEIPPETYRRIPREILRGICQTLEEIRVSFDEFVWESDFVLDGSVRGVIERARRSPRALSVDGALGVEASDYGLPKKDATVYLTRRDGTDLYPARDVAYHEYKFRRFDRVIDVLGEDHKLHSRGLLALLEAVGSSRQPEFVHYAFVNLPEGRMTTRGGRVVLLDDLLEEAVRRARDEVRRRRTDLEGGQAEQIARSVGTGAVRYHILRIQPEKPITFRWEEALSFEGKSAPFVQYAHARACSILRRAHEETPDLLAEVTSPSEGSSLAPRASLDPRERSLLLSLSRLPSLVDQISQSRGVHLLAVYAHEVAERFNEFYQALRVLNAGETERFHRLALVASTRHVLANTLGLMGIEALETM